MGTVLIRIDRQVYDILRSRADWPGGSPCGVIRKMLGMPLRKRGWPKGKKRKPMK